MRKKKLIVILSTLFILLGLTFLANKTKADDKMQFWVGGRPFCAYHNPYFGGPYRYRFFGPKSFWQDYRYPFWGWGPGYDYEWYRRERMNLSPYKGLDIKPAGNIIITVEPPQALVWVDGWPLSQQKDLSYRIGLLTGKHIVEVRAKGYKPYSKETEIQAGKRTSLSIQLKREGR